MGESTVKVILERGLTVKSLVLIIIYTFLFVPVNAYANQIAGGSAMIGSPLGVLFLVSLAGLFAKILRLTPQEAATFWTAVAIGAGGSFWIMYWGRLEAMIGFVYRLPESIYLRTVIPSFIVPTDTTILDAMWSGGTAMNLGVWLGPLIFFMLGAIAWAFTGLFLAGIIGRQMLEVEKLPFPVGMIVGYNVNFITKYEDSQRPKLFSLARGKYIWIGFIIGVIVFVPTVIVADWFPDFWPSLGISLPYPTQFSLGGWLNTVLAGLRAWAPVDTGLFFLPTTVVYAYLAPLDLTLTVWVLFFIFKWIWPIIGYGTGIIPAGKDYMNMQAWGGPNLYWIMGDGSGIWYGIALYWIVANRKVIVDSLKSALKASSGSETGYPPDRLLWAGLGASFLLIVLTNLAIGVPIVMAVIVAVIFILAQIAWARAMGEGYIAQVSGPRPWYSTIHQVADFGIATGIFPPPSGTTDRFDVGAYMTGYASNLYFGVIYQSPNRAADVLNYFRVAQMTRTSYWDIIKAVAITVIVGYFLGVLFATASLHAKGGANIAGYAFSPGFFTNMRGYALVGSVNPTDSSRALGGPAGYYSHFIAGIIIAFILYYLRTRYTWFFINPVGVVLSPIAFFALNAFLGWLLKYLTLKIGGTKVYEEVAIPFCVGWMLSIALLLGFLDPIGIFVMRGSQFKLGGF
ncbi:MAG: hypothetical protein FGF50_10925 [Candidatus Brockarchaeota archaeon]|nr:hypothetical protein [Candidatus Brockarchaeota archaeon]